MAANPLASRLGRPELSHFRLTFAQALNSLGTFIGPYLGALLFLKGMEVRGSLAVSDAVRFDALAGIDRAFFWIGGLLIALVVFFAFSRNLIQRASHSGSVDEPVSVTRMFRDATNSRWSFLGGLAIFLYVGAEVAIGTQMALFLNSDAYVEPGWLEPLLEVLESDPSVGAVAPCLPMAYMSICARTRFPLSIVASTPSRVSSMFATDSPSFRRMARTFS